MPHSHRRRPLGILRVTLACAVLAAVSPAAATAGWSSTTLSQSGDWSIATPRVAVTGTGRVAALAVDYRGLNSQPLINLYESTAGGSAFTRVTLHDARDAGYGLYPVRHASLRANGRGDLVAMWLIRTGANTGSLFVASRPAGTAGFREPQMLGTIQGVSNEFLDPPATAIGEDGSAAVAWFTTAGSDAEMKAAVLRPGAPAFQTHTLDGPRDFGSDDPSVAIDATGQVHVLYYRHDTAATTGEAGVWSRTLDSRANAFGQASRMANALAGARPRMVASPQGDMALIWDGYGTSWVRTRYRDEGAFGPAVEVAPGFGPAAFDAAGNMVTLNGGVDQPLKARWRPRGAAFGAEQEHGAGRYLRDARLFAGGVRPGARVAYTDHASTDRVTVLRFDGSGWSTVEASQTVPSASDLRVAAGADGRALVVWLESIEGGFRQRLSGLLAAPDPIASDPVTEPPPGDEQTGSDTPPPPEDANPAPVNPGPTTRDDVTFVGGPSTVRGFAHALEQVQCDEGAHPAGSYTWWLNDERLAQTGPRVRLRRGDAGRRISCRSTYSTRSPDVVISPPSQLRCRKERKGQGCRYVFNERAAREIQHAYYVNWLEHARDCTVQKAVDVAFIELMEAGFAKKLPGSKPVGDLLQFFDYVSQKVVVKWLIGYSDRCELAGKWSKITVILEALRRTKACRHGKLCIDVLHKVKNTRTRIFTKACDVTMSFAGHKSIEYRLKGRCPVLG